MKRYARTGSGVRDRGSENAQDLQDLKNEIADDLAALRRSWTRRQLWPPNLAGDLPAQAARVLRGYPAWMVGVVAGAIAGVWLAVRRRPPRASTLPDR